jgi:hypothetical protein
MFGHVPGACVVDGVDGIVVDGVVAAVVAVVDWLVDVVAPVAACAATAPPPSRAPAMVSPTSDLRSRVLIGFTSLIWSLPSMGGQHHSPLRAAWQPAYLHEHSGDTKDGTTGQRGGPR